MPSGIRRGSSCLDFESGPEPGIDPKPGEIWRINFPEACKAGHEIYGVRFAAIVSADHTHRFGLRLVIPFTEAKPRDERHILATVVDPTAGNGLSKPSAAWAIHVRNCDLRRFASHTPSGHLTSHELQCVRLTVRSWLGS